MLILKSDTKELFKKAGLEDFTIGRDSNGYLNIVGPCGKAIVPVTNFPVGSKLTNKEREIATNEYLIKILDEHGITIEEMIKHKAAFEDAKQNLEDELDLVNGGTVVHSIYWHGYNSSSDVFTLEAKYDEGKDDEIMKFHVELSTNEQTKVSLSSNTFANTKAMTKLINTAEKTVIRLGVIAANITDTNKLFDEASAKLIAECAL